MLKILKNKYAGVILILILCSVISNTSFIKALTGVNCAVIVYVLVFNDINDETFIWYSLIFGLYSDFVNGSYLGTCSLFFLFISVVKMFAEDKIDLKNNFSVNIFALFSIGLFNVFIASVSGFNIIVAFTYILRMMFTDFIVYMVIFYFMEFIRAFRRVER